MQKDAGGGKSHASVFPPRCDFHAQFCVTAVALSNIKPQIYSMGHEKVARVKANNMRSRTASGVRNADSTTVD
jgi:hypothetical protein